MKKAIVTTLVLQLCWHTALAQVPAADTIVFVCEHGSAKSMVAMLHFNRMARAAGLPYVAISRGTTPDASLPEKIKKGLAADGFNDMAIQPQKLHQKQLDAGHRVVSFCSLAGYVAPSQRLTLWTDVSALSDNYAKARAEIVSRLLDLLCTLSP